jgi:hypothetical protein
MKYRVKYRMSHGWDIESIMTREQFETFSNQYTEAYDSYIPKGSFKLSNFIIPFRNIKALEWKPIEDDE